ncbi:peptidoglycan-binding domain-containing protein [Pseudovibrio exalbescens]|uniref:Peptidoglycan binding-like domain-containing protein n=1 Tax=Pseudovibrio exalbescens TaxID=197461 RepID=A0A1U7JM67_9HYPH|nr:peptidoglycan-binding domain-containing protein [Pseudovibrio exalbescens]OKL45823.1 hypothetical protein A3843_01470 [Pseudovibrio exalbescens]
MAGARWLFGGVVSVGLAAMMVSAALAQDQERSSEAAADPQETDGVSRGGIFCTADTFAVDVIEQDSELCRDGDEENCLPKTETDVTFLLGEDIAGERRFGYDVWFEDGRNCSIIGDLVQNDEGQWVYEDLGCRFSLELDEEGAVLRSLTGAACESGCGANARLAALRVSWPDSRFKHAPLLNTYEDMALCLPSAPPDSVFTEEILQIFTVQRILTKLGYDLGPIDGKLGPMTREAIAKYRELEDLPAQEAIDQALVDRLVVAEDALPQDEQELDPAGMLQALYDADEPMVDVFEPPLRDSWFSRRVLDLIAYAEQRGELLYGERGLFFNPIVPGNEIKLADLKIAPARVEGDTARVEVFFRNFDSRYALRYDLIRTDKGWRINDIVTPTGSLQSTLKGI